MIIPAVPLLTRLEKNRSPAKAHAPANRESLCVKVGQTLSSANPVRFFLKP